MTSVAAIRRTQMGFGSGARESNASSTVVASSSSPTPSGRGSAHGKRHPRVARDVRGARPALPSFGKREHARRASALEQRSLGNPLLHEEVRNRLAGEGSNQGRAREVDAWTVQPVSNRTCVVSFVTAIDVVSHLRVRVSGAPTPFGGGLRGLRSALCCDLDSRVGVLRQSWAGMS